jgi:hypothetical protein
MQAASALKLNWRADGIFEVCPGGLITNDRVEISLHRIEIGALTDYCVADVIIFAFVTLPSDSCYFLCIREQVGLVQKNIVPSGNDFLVCDLYAADIVF